MAEELVKFLRDQSLYRCGQEGEERDWKNKMNACADELERRADMLFASIPYIEIYAETIRHEPWKQQALDLIAGIQAVPGARDHQN